MKTLNVSPHSNGSFPVVPHGQVISLSLGNGSRFDVIVTQSVNGLVLSVVGKGAYWFHFAPSYAYLGGKLGLLDGDAICFVRFLSAQLDGAPLRFSPHSSIHSACQVASPSPL